MERAAIISRVKIKMDEFTPAGVGLPFEDYIGPVLDEAAKELAEMVPLHFLSPRSLVLSTTKRSIDTNVATLTLASPHGYFVGDYVTVAGITTHLEYNGTFQVTAVSSDRLSFSYALTHANETETADTGGYVSPRIIIEDNRAYISKPSDFLRLYEMKFPLWTKPVREVTKVDSEVGRRQENPYLKSGIGRPSVVLHTTQPAGGSLGEYLICGRVETSTLPKALYVPIQKPEELKDQIIDQLVWFTAVKMFIITGYPDKAKLVNEQFGLSMQLLIQV